MTRDGALPRPYHRRLAEGIIEQLTAQIRSGALAPGQRLPSERTLARNLGVSRTVVREALMYMQRAGLVETRQGSGTYVQVGIGDTGNHMDFAHARNKHRQHVSMADIRQEVVWLFELRMGIETEAAALAARRAHEHQRAQISAAVEKFHAEAAREQLGIEADFEFHMAIVRASNNPYLVDVLSNMTDRLVESVTLSRVRTIAVPARSSIVEQEHRAICERIMAGDAIGASRAMRDHLEAAFHRLGPSMSDARQSMSMKSHPPT